MAESEKPAGKKGLCGKCPCGIGSPICLICVIIALLIVLKLAGVI